MNLNAFPLEVIRNVCASLSTPDLAELLATFDRRLQRLIVASSPRCRLTSFAGKQIYLLTSLRNVPELDVTVVTRGQSAPLTFDADIFRNLNPRLLKVGPLTLSHNDTRPAFLFDPTEPNVDPSVESSNGDSGSQSRPSGVTLADYAPALRHIAFASGLMAKFPEGKAGCFAEFQENWQAGLGLPPTLLSLVLLKCTHFDGRALIPGLPPSLTTLVLHSSATFGKPHFGLATVFSALPALTRLELKLPHTVYMPSSFEPPASLTELTLGDCASFPLDMLRNPSFKAISSLTKLTIISFLQLPQEQYSAQDAYLDLANLLPTGLTSLAVEAPSSGTYSGHQATLCSFPPGLTELQLRSLFTTDSDLGPALFALRHLTSLSLKSDTLLTKVRWTTEAIPAPTGRFNPSSLLFDLSALPRSLTYLDVNGSAIVGMTEDQVAVLPKSLTSVRFRAPDLVMANAFHNLLPACALRFLVPFEVFEAPEQLPQLLDKFAHLIEPVFDTALLSTAVEAHYASNRTPLLLGFSKSNFGFGRTSSYPSLKSTSYVHTLGPSNPFSSGIPETQFLTSAFPLLTSLHLRSAKNFHYRMAALPPTLTRLALERIDIELLSELNSSMTCISSDASCTGMPIDLDKLSDLTHFDAPKWTVYSSNPLAAVRSDVHLVVANVLNLDTLPKASDGNAGSSSSSMFGFSGPGFGTPSTNAFGASANPFATSASANAFGASSTNFFAAPSTGAFGASTAPSSNAFGASANSFGASAAPSKSAFGASGNAFGA